MNRLLVSRRQTKGIRISHAKFFGQPRVCDIVCFNSGRSGYVPRYAAPGLNDLVAPGSPLDVVPGKHSRFTSTILDYQESLEYLPSYIFPPYHECQLLHPQPWGPTDPVQLTISNPDICGSKEVFHSVGNNKIRIGNAPPWKPIVLNTYKSAGMYHPADPHSWLQGTGAARDPVPDVHGLSTYTPVVNQKASPSSQVLVPNTPPVVEKN